MNRFHLSLEIREALQVLEYKTPTPIQEKVIPLALKGENIRVQSKTGSGKTAAFGIPLCENIEWDRRAPQALVLEPTRELTVQVKQELYLIGRYKRLKVADVFGGFPIDKQIQTLRQKTHIVVGTPGRLMDHIRRGTIVLDEIQAIVVDEADLMLDMGFIDEVKDILSLVPPVCQQMIFSATLGDRILDFIGDQIKDAVTLCEEISEHEVLDISESYIMTDSDEKYGTLRNILIMENPDRCMIFCGTKEMVNVLCRKLRRDGVRCGMIHGDMDQQARLRAVDEFRSGRIRYFIVTDVVARGIDFENLTHVINYDYPTGKQTYVHRIGRTGRNGKTGVAVSLVTPDEMSMVKQVERYRGQSVEFRKRERPSKEQEKSFLSRQQEKIAREKSKASGFRRTISKLTIGGGRKSKMRAVDIVGTLCNLRDVSSDDIGAIDIRDSITYVEILNGKGDSVCNQLQDRPIKGKVRKVRISR